MDGVRDNPCPGRYICTGHWLMTYVDETVYFESILTKGIVLVMLTSHAWQAAGRFVRGTQCVPTKVMLCLTPSSIGLVLIFFPCCCESDVCDVDIRRELYVTLCSRSSTNSEVCLRAIPFCPRTPRLNENMATPDCLVRFGTHDAQCDGHWLRRFAHCSHLRKFCSASRHPRLAGRDPAE